MIKRQFSANLPRMKMPPFLLLFIVLLLASCGNQYKTLSKQYSFRAANGQPDYTSPDYWAALPWKKDPSDSVPLPLQQEQRDTLADVFFLHPTTYTSLKKKTGDNAAIDDAYLAAKTDYTTILYQASAFNQHARIFAPRYRQAHIQTFFMTDKERAEKIFEMAYTDLRTAFQYYLQHWNKGRPIIIAAHSQGSLLAERLLKEFFENKPLGKQLVSAYIIGWPVAKDYSATIPVCRDSTQTGCICSWRTFRRNYVPLWLRKEKGNAWVTNPLSWTTDEQFVPRSFNRGSVLQKFNKLYPHTSDAWIQNGLLYTRKPRFPWSFLFMTKNYHVGDINLYYINVRDNVEQRVHAFLRR